jgi:hypothetical protein
MKLYRVTVELEVEAADEEQAARMAEQDVSASSFESVLGVRPVKTLFYSENPHACPGYTMLSFFSFTGDDLHVGQSQHVKNEDLAAEKAALARNGWTPGGYKYVNGKAVLL